MPEDAHAIRVAIYKIERLEARLLALGGERRSNGEIVVPGAPRRRRKVPSLK